MRYLEQATYRHAKGGCFRHGQNKDGVDFDIDIIGPDGGALFLCVECIRDANNLARTGRARKVKRDKAYEKATREREAV